MVRRLAAVAVLVLASVGRAETNIVDSLEWTTVSSRLIVTGKVVRTEDTKGPGDVVYRDVTIEVADVLKGKFDGKRLTIRVRLLGNDRTGLDWKESDRPHLFLLTQGNPGDDKNLGGQWVPRSYEGAVVDLEKPRKVYTSDLKRADDGKAIVALVKKYAATKLPREVDAANVGTPRRGFVRLDVPGDSPIFGELWGGSAVYINVPAEEKYRPMATALARSNNGGERRLGAEMLRNFPGEQTVRILKELLRDPAETKWVGAGNKIVNITYDVRRAAYDSLIDLGEKPARPLFERDPAAGDQEKK
jgi:hypothetical protein